MSKYTTMQISFMKNLLKQKILETSTENLNVQIKKLKNIGLKNLEKNKELSFLGLNQNEITKMIFNLKKNDIGEIIEDKNNNLHYIHLNKLALQKKKVYLK